MSRADEICPRPDPVPPSKTVPHSTPIYLTSVWSCESPEQADAILGKQLPGYVYQRDANPNSDLLAAKCRELHAAEQTILTSSGMAALATVVLSQLRPGDHLLLSRHLYGKTTQLMGDECARWGIDHTRVDSTNLTAVAESMTPRTRLVVVETIANPRLQVADLQQIATLCRSRNAKLLVDNTFATPYLCRPLEWGADFVMESVSKMMNGHSDVMLGLLAGRTADWSRVAQTVSTWGLASSPFEAWLSARGLATLSVRMERACDNALAIARFLTHAKEVVSVDYPGLPQHPQHELAKRQFAGRFGSIVTFHLRGGRKAADAFIAAARDIPFCPSLGEVSTTLSHPESTSHRGLTADARRELGIDGGTLRLSVGIESHSQIEHRLQEALGAVASCT